MRKLTYTVVKYGSSADQKLRTHSRSSSKPSAVAVAPPMLYVKPAFRPLNAVSFSPTRATAPPICQIGNDVSGEEIRSECSTVASMISSVSPGTSQLLTYYQ